MSATRDYSIELLAPARDLDVAVAAINHGADAVYMGASSHGARAAASNSIDDIASAVKYAHRFGARVYVTVNTLMYSGEERKVEELVRDLYRVGVDALIVQDLGLLRLDLPPIALHASTQCDIRTPQKARFLEDLGFSQLVLPREFTAQEIKAVREATTVPLEAFVHGALCVSYSGQCYASLACGGRSANRGECAQICRLPYDLVDGKGRTLVSGSHLLSLRDLNRLDSLPRMLDAGISSLKIEGRLKDAAYVKNVVSAYDRRLRELGVPRTSDGTVERTFTPDVSRSFNRGFTPGFLTNARQTGVGAMESPKSLGRDVATVVSVRGTRIEVRPLEPLANGDGLTFTDARGKVCGFRVNKMEGARVIHTSAPVMALKPGMRLRRNSDRQWNQVMADEKSAVRTIPLDMTLRRAGSQLVLEANGVAATLEAPEPQTAKTPQTEARRRVLAKLGDTPYRLTRLTDLLADEFIPASQLTTLRRSLTDLLAIQRDSTHQRPLRSAEKPDARWEETLTALDNVANPEAAQVLREHGAKGPIARAPEVEMPADKDFPVMATRHCIRRELGRCLLTPEGRQWPEPLTLTGGPRPLRLSFDCRACQMHLHLAE